MLDKRAQILLKTLIERYIAEGQPVGSRTLSKFSGLDLSPATIRNVMADLEEMGFIASPHTSAGRVPTPLGYRFFVDTLLVVQADRVAGAARSSRASCIPTTRSAWSRRLAAALAAHPFRRRGDDAAAPRRRPSATSNSSGSRKSASC